MGAEGDWLTGGYEDSLFQVDDEKPRSSFGPVAEQ